MLCIFTCWLNFNICLTNFTNLPYGKKNKIKQNDVKQYENCISIVYLFQLKYELFYPP